MEKIAKENATQQRPCYDPKPNATIFHPTNQVPNTHSEIDTHLGVLFE
jgi:hypothetical protein